MASDAETIRAIEHEEVLDAIAFVRVLFEPSGELGFRPAMPVGQRSFEVGRSSDVRLSLDDPRASRKHAVFHPQDGGRRSGARGHVQQRHLHQRSAAPGRAALGDGDVVRVGDSFLLVRVTSPAPGGDAEIPPIVGRHPAMIALRRTIASVGPTDAKVLIMGDSGTGKELVARAIHERSGRGGRFVAVNCSAIPEALAESQLFGHEPGAFTGATGRHTGFVRAAEGGTLFLDEIGELTPLLQPKLLRALEEQEVVPVGSTQPVPVDIRLIAATHRNLLAEVDAGRFRGDLYARIAGYLMHTIPLRDRREDILPLLATFLGDEAPPLAADLAEALLLHPYRFNVRELKEMATQLEIDGAGHRTLTRALLSQRLSGRMTPAPAPSVEDATLRETPRSKRPPPERHEVVALLEKSGGNVSQVARELGRSRRQVYRYLEQWGLSADDFTP